MLQKGNKTSSWKTADMLQPGESDETVSPAHADSGSYGPSELKDISREPLSAFSVRLHATALLQVVAHQGSWMLALEKRMRQASSIAMLSAEGAALHKP